MMAGWIAIAAAVAAPGAALATEKANFTVHDVTLSVDLPAGYCLPKNNDGLIAETLAKSDPQNLTLATFIRCDRQNRPEGPGNDYVLIKSPNAALTQRVERAKLLSELNAEFGKPEWQTDGNGSKQSIATASQNLSDNLGGKFDIKGAIAPRGVDADCAYLGGTLQLSGGGVSYPIIGGACITGVNGKIVAVYTYDDPDRGGGVIGKMRMARNLAMSIKAKP